MFHRMFHCVSVGEDGRVTAHGTLVWGRKLWVFLERRGLGGWGWGREGGRGRRGRGVIMGEIGGNVK